MIAADVEWGIHQLGLRRREYALYEAYYQGRHRLAFATKRVEDAFGTLFRAFALNLAAVVVDSYADRLQIVGFSTPGGEGAVASVQRVWERNGMAYRSSRVHRELLAQGDAYVHVWQDPQGMVRIYDETPLEVIGHQDPDVPGELDYAVKAWREGKRVRVTVYYRDRIERYITRSDTDRLPSGAQYLRPLEDADVAPGRDGRPEVPNPWGVVPVLHLANRPDRTGYGVSELRDVLPPQDALNKTVADMLASGEADALPLRFLIGVTPEKNPDGTVKPIFSETKSQAVTLPKGADVKELVGADPARLLAVKGEFAADIARVSGVPLHQLLLVGANDWPSGTALRVAEARMVAKADHMVEGLGPQWARVVALATRMAQGDPGEVRTLWEPTATPLDETEAAAAAEAKQRAGIPREQTWREMGYSDAQIEQFSQAYAAEEERRAAAEARAFNAGAPASTGGL